MTISFCHNNYFVAGFGIYMKKHRINDISSYITLKVKRRSKLAFHSSVSLLFRPDLKLRLNLPVFECDAPITRIIKQSIPQMVHMFTHRTLTFCLFTIHKSKEKKQVSFLPVRNYSSYHREKKPVASQRLCLCF